MAADVLVRIDDLRSAIAKVLDRVEDEMGSTVDLDADYYWWLDPSDMFAMGSDEPEICVGQLCDDIEELHGIRSREQVVIWHDLAHIAGLLLRISALDDPT